MHEQLSLRRRLLLCTQFKVTLAVHVTLNKINNLCRLWRNCIRSYIGDHAKASLSMKLIGFAGNVAILISETK